MQEYSTFVDTDVTNGLCDILFPTNFAHLCSLYSSLAPPPRSQPGAHDDGNNDSGTADTLRAPTSFTQRSFLEHFGEWERASTRCGYNPMLEDYANMRVFVGGLRQE